MDLSVVVGLVGLIARFMPAGTGVTGELLTLLAQYGTPISALIKAGEPVLSAVEKNSPALLAALHKFAGALGDNSVLGAAAVAKAILVPHMTTQEENAFFDRASSPDRS